MTRREFLNYMLLSLGSGLGADASILEPEWVEIAEIKLAKSPSVRILHFTDFHFKGDHFYAQKIINLINGLRPDLVCFTGDLIENVKYMDPALAYIRQIECPVFGVPGNHDLWSGAPFSSFRRAFAGTGGAWLVNDSVTAEGTGLQITGITNVESVELQPGPGKNILLTHWPALADYLPARFNLILAGHSHGGQVRLPYIGALVLPDKVGNYVCGLFQTKAGPLYVSRGTGTALFPLRLNCRPELTIIQI